MLTTRRGRGKRERERFVILFPGRAGSSYLVTMLAAHPQIEVKSEVLGALRKDGSSAQLEWAARFLRGPLVSRHKAFGFKTKLRDVMFVTELHWLFPRDCHVRDVVRSHSPVPDT